MQCGLLDSKKNLLTSKSLTAQGVLYLTVYNRVNAKLAVACVLGAEGGMPV